MTNQEYHWALISGRVVTCAGKSALRVLTNERAGMERADQSEARDVEITSADHVHWTHISDT